MPKQSRAYQIAASKLLYLLEIAAVICLTLVVAAYVEVVGYIGIGLASFIALSVIISIFS